MRLFRRVYRSDKGEGYETFRGMFKVAFFSPQVVLFYPRRTMENILAEWDGDKYSKYGEARANVGNEHI